jgi:hypothetical protein
MSDDNGTVPMRQCPTRADAHRPLISHLITVDLCLARQGESYHKCLLCQFRNAALTEVTTRRIVAPPPPPEKVKVAARGPRKVREAGTAS